MPLLTSNNVKKIIAVPVDPSDTEITLVDVIGLPNVSDPSDWTVLTLIRLSDLKQEIVRVDNIVGNTLTVQRAQEATAAISFIGGDEARNFFTSGMFQETTALTNRLAAEAAAQAAATSADTSEAFAQEAEDVEVQPGLFSAFHWAQKSMENAGDSFNDFITGVNNNNNVVFFDDGSDIGSIKTGYFHVGSTVTGTPYSSSWLGFSYGDSTTTYQIVSQTGGTETYIRLKTSGVWQDWDQISTFKSPLAVKAFVTFDGTNGNIINAHNVSSVVRNSVGLYSVFFPGGVFVGAGYTMISSSANIGQTRIAQQDVTVNPVKTTTQMNVECRASSSYSLRDPLLISLSFFEN